MVHAARCSRCPLTVSLEFLHITCGEQLQREGGGEERNEAGAEDNGTDDEDGDIRGRGQGGRDRLEVAGRGRNETVSPVNIAVRRDDGET